MARSFWVSHDQAISANPESGIPLVSARVLGPRDAGETVVLAPALASEPNLAEFRVVWIRNPGDTSSMGTAMSTVETSIRRLIPQQGLVATFTEVLVPESLADLAIPPPPADWQQVVVEPRDRPYPSAPDSFYDQATAPRQGLHAALMIGGILGGNNHELAVPREARIADPWVVHPFTRVVRGADRVRRLTIEAVHERLPAISAAEVAPDRFLVPDPTEASDYVDDAVTWIQSLDSGALRFLRPRIDFDRRGQTFREFLVAVARFFWWALRGMFGLQRWIDLILTIRSRLARRLEAEDYGATVDSGAPTPAGLNLTDWDAKEAESQARHAPRIVEAARADGRMPDRVVWLSLTELVASLIDGSASPLGWEGRTRFNRSFVLAPKSVLRFEPVLEDVPQASETIGQNELSDEIEGFRRIGATEFDYALTLTAIGLANPIVEFSTPVGQVAKTAQMIGNQAKSEQAEAREVMLAAFGRTPRDVTKTGIPLLGRVRAAVVSDLLLSRFASEQLSAVTKTSVPNSLPKLQKMLRDATWILLGIVGIGIGIVALFGRFGAEIDALLALMQIPYPTSWTELAAWVVFVMSALLVGLMGRMFYAYRAYDEVGQRRLEYVEKRSNAAVFALVERNRLRNAERVLTDWEDILSSVAAGDEISVAPAAPAPAGLPDALQIAEPDLDDEDLRELAIHETIRPGWMTDALDALMSGALDKDELDKVWQDDGLPGGPLAALQAAALDGDIHRDWWSGWTESGAARVIMKLGASGTRLRLVAGDPTEILLVEHFVGEIAQQLTPEYKPGSDYEILFNGSRGGQRIVASARLDNVRYTPNDTLTLVETVLILRRLGRVPISQGREAPTPSPTDDSRTGRV